MVAVGILVPKAPQKRQASKRRSAETSSASSSSEEPRRSTKAWICAFVGCFILFAFALAVTGIAVKETASPAPQATATGNVEAPAKLGVNDEKAAQPMLKDSEAPQKLAPPQKLEKKQELSPIQKGSPAGEFKDNGDEGPKMKIRPSGRYPQYKFEYKPFLESRETEPK